MPWNFGFQTLIQIPKWKGSLYALNQTYRSLAKRRAHGLLIRYLSAASGLDESRTLGLTLKFEHDEITADQASTDQGS
jgi:hypothetical protein